LDGTKDLFELADGYDAPQDQDHDADELDEGGDPVQEMSPRRRMRSA
jgi:hypothetical protein